MKSMNLVNQEIFNKIYSFYALSLNSGFTNYAGFESSPASNIINDFAYHTPLPHINNKINQYTSQKIPSEKRSPSCRNFNSKEISCAELIDLLTISFGETKQRLKQYRPYPSGGALYPIHIYGYIKSESVAFIYDPQKHNIQIILDNISHSEILSSLGIKNDDAIGNFSVMLLYCFDPLKPIVKYGYRGYRNALLECGSMYQTLSLLLPEYKFRDVIYSGFNDIALALTLGIEPRRAWPLITHLIGR